MNDTAQPFSEEVQSWTLGLGGDFCETCGYSYNEVEVEEHEDGLYSARYSVGRYGGNATDKRGTLDELAEWIGAEIPEGLPIVASIRSGAEPDWRRDS